MAKIRKHLFQQFNIINVYVVDGRNILSIITHMYIQTFVYKIASILLLKPIESRFREY